jgi:D-amino-acid dehydrogenase
MLPSGGGLGDFDNRGRFGRWQRTMAASAAVTDNRQVEGRVVVVGGGVIGLSCAYQLLKLGADVTVVERRTLGDAASWGNAGWITPLLSGPVPAPGAIAEGLRSLWHPDSPVYLKPAAIPALSGWLARFALHCRPEPYLRGLEVVATLARQAFDAYRRLRSDGIDVRIRGTGHVFAFLDERAVDEWRAALAPMERHGYRLPPTLNGDAARELEPSLSDAVRAAVLVEPERYVQPKELTTALAARVREMGGTVLEGTEVVGFRRAGARVSGVLAAGVELPADRVVLAAGAWTGLVARLLGARLPLQGGKGYSFSVRPPVMPRTALYLVEAHVGVSPFDDHVRLAGTMELSGINEELAEARLRGIEQAARRYLRGPWPGERADAWTGMRPLTPDGLPVIGPLPDLPQVHVATGHSMLGVTLGPVTGEVVARQMSTGQVAPELAPLLPSRFR